MPNETTENKWRVEEVQTIARNFLLAAPNGLAARTLCDAMVQQGIPEDAASLVIRSGMDDGTIRLAPNMQLIFW